MKTKLTLLLLFFCLLSMAAQVAEDDKYWTEFVSDTEITTIKEGNPDIVYTSDGEKTTYTIYTAKGLAWVAKVTNDESVKEEVESEAKYYPAVAGFKDCTVELGDIAGGKLDISGHKWVPIGNGYNNFKGTFDGKSQEITGLWIEEENVTSFKYYGLFGYTDEATIKNLGIQIETFSIDGGGNSKNLVAYVGGIVGSAYRSAISNCYVYGDEGATIQAKNINNCEVGGLIGENSGNNSSLTNNYSMINITANSNRINWIGGIAGYLSGTLTNTFATGSIVVTSPEKESYIGGICGLCEYETLNSNLALNKGGITVTNDKEVTVHVGYICGDNDNIIVDNYVSSNFAILGEDITYNEGEEGKIIGSETDLAAILNGGSTENKIWSFSEKYGLPYIDAFGEDNQPTASADKKDYEVGALDLATFKTDKSIIYLKYIKGSGWYVSDDKDTETAPFNGEISGTDITKEVYITGGADSKDAPTLNVVGDLGIETKGECGMLISGSVNLTVTEGNKLNISGQWGLGTIGNITLNQSLSKLRDTGNGGITIVGTEHEGIQNQGTLNINVDKLTVEGKGNSGYGIVNFGTLNCNTGLIEINGGNGIGNDPDGNFNIQGAEVTINQGTSYAIYNKGAFNIAPTGTLNILTLEGIKPKIANDEGTTFTLEPGATFLTWQKDATKPTAYTLTYSDPSEGNLLIRNQNGITIPSKVNIGAGTELTVTVSGNTKEIENVIYTQAGGSATNATPTGATGTYTFTMPAAATEVSVKFKKDPEPEPEPDDDDDDTGVVTPTVYYTVTLPEVEGATLDPGAGDYDVESWSTFRFYLTLAPEYDQSLPIVTTDRGETIAPRQSDGAYLVKFVRTNVAITIDGIVKNPDPVANDAVDADNITIRRTADGLLIHVPSPETLTLYTFAGTLVRTIHLPAGDTRIDVPTGTYIVRVGTKVEKVIL